ncbi:MAG: hypothetical protein ACE5EG_04260 [Thermoanaerobaculia bacterium]
MALRETEPIGQLLLDHGWISPEQLSLALERQNNLGGRLGTALLEMGVVSEEVLVKTLADQGGLQVADIDELRDIASEILELVPAKVAIRHKAVPFRTARGQVSLAVRQEPDIPVLDELSFVLGRRVVIHIANEARIYEALEHYYGDTCPLRFRHLLDRLNQTRDHPEESPPPAVAAAPPATSRRRRIRSAASRAQPPAVIPAPPPPPRPTSVPLSADEKRALSEREREEAVEPLSLEGVQRALQAARRADDIGIALLGFLGQEFLRLLVFRVGKGRVRGWMGSSPTFDEYAFRNWQVGFDEPSVFLNLRQGAEFFLGRLPAMPAHERLLKCWRGSLDTECAVFPVKVRDRLVCAIYGDRDSLGLAGLDVPVIQRLTAKAAIAFEMLLMQRKLRS